MKLSDKEQTAADKIVDALQGLPKSTQRSVLEAAAVKHAGGPYKEIGLDETVDLRDPRNRNFITLHKGDAAAAARDLGYGAGFADGVSDLLNTLEPKKRQEFFRAMSGKRAEREKLEDELTAIRDFRATLDEWANNGLRLERPAGSAAHRYVQAFREGKVAAYSAHLGDALAAIGKVAPVPFVIEHDWAAAFENAPDVSDGPYPLPFDDVVFEFRISRVAVLVFANERGTCVVAEMGKGGNWMALSAEPHHVSELSPPDDDADYAALVTVLLRQIRAVCIALDAEVATTDTMRAPERLNRSRERGGKPPLLDYHVVRLARRTRATALPEDHEPNGKRSPRMHFVRGHWRHYENHKTWIKWHLRGDPDLGFIDKHYRL